MQITITDAMGGWDTFTIDGSTVTWVGGSDDEPGVTVEVTP